MSGHSHEVDVLLAQLLTPHIGHSTKNWPGTLSRLLRRMAADEHTDERGVLKRILAREDREKLERLIAAATVPHTAFFRHPEQFDALSALLPKLAAQARRPLRLWSAGCATGEEAYSLALCAHEAGVDATVLATDVSPECIRIARAACYSATRAANVRPANAKGEWSPPDSVRRRVRFEVCSITGPDPGMGKAPFDVIFCRNVLVYFERAAACKVLEQLGALLQPHGVLVVSPSEVVGLMPPRLRRIEPAGFLCELPRGTAVRARSVRPMPQRRVSERPSANAHLEHAAELLGSGNPGASEAELRNILTQSPHDPVSWFLLGEALVARGEPAQARAAFLRAAECATTGVTGIEPTTLARVAKRRANAI